MKVLIVTPHVPASKAMQAGEKLLCGLIRLLSERHEIHLVVRVCRGEEGSLEPMSAYCTKIYPVIYDRPERKNIFTIWRVILSYLRLCQSANAISQMETYDTIHVEWTEAGAFMKSKGRMVICAVDVLAKPMKRRYDTADGIRRFVFAILYWLTKRLECHIYRKFHTVFVMSEYDKKFLLAMEPSLNVQVLTHPVYMPQGRERERETKSLLFVGAMDRGPNIEAVSYFSKAILPLIRRHMPDVRFYVVGSRPLPEVCELGRYDENITVTGFVEDLESYYGRAYVFVAPLLRGGGIIVKIIEAMAAGLPVVTTSIGNEGIGAEDGSHLLVANTPNEFAEKVMRLFLDEELWRDVSRAGRDFARGRFSLENLRESLERSYPES